MEARFETFASLINQINRNLQRLKRLEMRELGLQAGHTMCVFYLRNYPDGLTGSQLAALCEEDKAAVSRALAELEEAGLVVGPDNGGKKRYRAKMKLTEEGRIRAEKLNQRVEGMLERIGGFMNEEERQIFYRGLGAIAEGLQESCDRREKQAKETI